MDTEVLERLVTALERLATASEKIVQNGEQLSAAALKMAEALDCITIELGDIKIALEMNKS
jgi:hypothetical protein